MSHTTFYILDGKNTRLMDCVERREFERQTIDNNKGFVLQIPFLEHTFGTLYYVIDKQNGCMIGIIDDQLQSIECGTQMEPFDLAQLSHMNHNMGTEKAGFLMVHLLQNVLHTTTECDTQVHLKILGPLIP